MFYKLAAELEEEMVATKAALGELMLMKTAGQINNRTFVDEANVLIEKIAEDAKKEEGLFKRLGKRISEGWGNAKAHIGRNAGKYGLGGGFAGGLGASALAYYLLNKNKK